MWFSTCIVGTWNFWWLGAPPKSRQAPWLVDWWRGNWKIGSFGVSGWTYKNIWNHDPTITMGQFSPLSPSVLGAHPLSTIYRVCHFITWTTPPKIGETRTITKGDVYLSIFRVDFPCNKVSKWLITMVSKSPNWGCFFYKWPKWLINGGS